MCHRRKYPPATLSHHALACSRTCHARITCSALAKSKNGPQKKRDTRCVSTVSSPMYALTIVQPWAGVVLCCQITVQLILTVVPAKGSTAPSDPHRARDDSTIRLQGRCCLMLLFMLVCLRRTRRCERMLWRVQRRRQRSTQGGGSAAGICRLVP